MDDFTETYGPWALVAGGSEGLGLAFADELARRGLGLIVVAHEAEPLAAAATHLRGRGVEVIDVLADLGTGEGVASVLAACEGHDVGLFVANAAVAPRGLFVETPVEQLLAAVRVNVEAPVRLSHALAGPMRDRGRGGIILVSSLSSLQGTAVFSTYAATKAFLRVQAEGLWEELGRDGVDVLSVVPGTIDTPGLRSSAPRGGPMPMAPAIVVEAALDGLGKGPVVFPSGKDRWTSRLLTRVIPRSRAIRLVSATTRRMYLG